MLDVPTRLPVDLASRVRVAARALARAGLVHAYGHCSARVGAEEFVCSPAKPLGSVTPADEVVSVPVSGALPPAALPEVILHQRIYALRSDVGGIARFQSPSLIALSALGLTPRARHGLGAYFAPHAPLYADPRLVRDADSALAAAMTLGAARAVVLRGNGAVTVGSTLEEAVSLAWYLEDAARVELVVLGAASKAWSSPRRRPATAPSTRAGCSRECGII